jgi:hypothetical protein
MLRWRKDKPVSEADTLETLKAMISVGTTLPAVTDGAE